MNNNVENFESTLNIKKADERILKILKKTKDHSYNNLIKSTHKWCANMRDSKSLSTACLPLETSQKKLKCTSLFQFAVLHVIVKFLKKMVIFTFHSVKKTICTI